MTARQSVALCIGGTLLLRLGNSATGVFMGLLLAALDRARGDVPATAVGLLAASFYLTELLGAPWFGAQSDRVGRRAFMVAGPIFGLVAIQLIGWPSLLVGWPWLLGAMAVGRLIEGLSTASSAPSTLSFLSARTADSAVYRVRVMAWYEMATVVGIGSGFVAGGLLWDLLGHGAVIAGSAIYAASLFVFTRVRDSVAGPTGARSGGLGRVLRTRAVLRFVPAWLLVNTVVGVWFTHAAFQLTGAQQPGQQLAGAFSGTSLAGSFALFSGAFILGVYGWGMAIGARRKTSVMAVTVLGLYVVCFALYGLNHLPGDGALKAGIVALFLAGVVIESGFTPAALAYLADLSEEMAEQRGAVMGLYSVMLGVGQLLGSALGGPFAEVGGVDGLILLTGLLGAGALGAVLLLQRYEDTRRIAEWGNP